MRAILRDSKGWTKTLTIPYPMQQIRLPLHRKRIDIWEVNEGSWVTRDKSSEMVIFELTGRGLSDDVAYYDELNGGASSNVSSPYGESNGGANPSPAPKSGKRVK